MADRTELLEVALDSLLEGLALLGSEGQIMLWTGRRRRLPATAALICCRDRLPNNWSRC